MKNILSSIFSAFLLASVATAQPNYIDNIVVSGTSSLSGTFSDSGTWSISGPRYVNTGGSINLTGGTLSLSSGTVTGASAIIPSSLISGFGSNAIALLITGSASPAANSASLSMGSGTTLTTSGSGTLTFTGGLLSPSSIPTTLTIATISNLTSIGGGLVRVNNAGLTSVDVTLYSQINVVTSAFGISGIANNTTITLSGPYNFGITGSASPALNSASLSLAPGITFSLSGSGTLSLSSGLNTVASFTNSGAVSGFVVADSTGLQSTTSSVPISSLSSPIALLITSSASPAAKSASLSMASGTTLTTSGSGTLSLSSGGPNLFPAVSISGTLTVGATATFTNGTVTASINAASFSSDFGVNQNIIFRPFTATNGSAGNSAYNEISLNANSSREVRLGVSGSGVGVTNGGYVYAGNVPLYLFGNGSTVLTLTSSSAAAFASGVTVNMATLSGTIFSFTSGTLSGTVSLSGKFDGVNGIRLASTGSPSNVLILKSATQSGNRTLTISQDTDVTITPSNLVYSGTNVTFNTATATSAMVSPTATHSSLTVTNSVNFTGLSSSGFNDILEIDGSDGSNTGAVDYISIAGLATQLGISSRWDSRRNAPLKINIRPFTGGLDFARKVQVHLFNWTPGNSYGFQPHIDEVGFIADEVDKVLPEAVIKTGHDPSVRDRALIAVAFNSVHELDASTTALFRRMTWVTAGGFAVLLALVLSLRQHRKSHRRHKANEEAIAALTTELKKHRNQS